MKIYLLISAPDRSAPDHGLVASDAAYLSVESAKLAGDRQHREQTGGSVSLTWSALRPPSPGRHGGVICDAVDEASGVAYYVREVEVRS